jgi:hypothetical protein
LKTNLSKALRENPGASPGKIRELTIRLLHWSSEAVPPTHVVLGLMNFPKKHSLTHKREKIVKTKKKEKKVNQVGETSNLKEKNEVKNFKLKISAAQANTSFERVIAKPDWAALGGGRKFSPPKQTFRSWFGFEFTGRFFLY